MPNIQAEQPDTLEEFLANLREQAAGPEVNFDLSPPTAPESDKSLGRPLAAPQSGLNVGVAPVPSPVVNRPPEGTPAPPVPTSQGLNLDEPAKPSPVAGPQTDLDSFKRDPNDILREAYKPAIDMALEARKKDMARMDSPEARMTAYGHLAAGLNANSPALQTAGADLLKKSKFDPIYGESLEQAGKSGQAIAAAQTASLDLDPESPKSRAARLAFHSSDQFDETARKMSEQTGISEQDARAALYKGTQGLTAVGINAFTAVMKSSNDWSKGRAEIAVEYAKKRQADVLTHQINVETTNKDTLYKAWNSPVSAISKSQRELYRSLLPHGVAESNPDFNKLTAHELAATYPQMAEVAAGIMKWQQEYNIKLASDTVVDNDWTVNTQTVPGPVPGMPGKQVPNPIGVANKARFLQQTNAAKVAIDSADQLFRTVDPSTAVSYSMQTTDGQRVYNNLVTFARNAATLSPSGAALLEQLTNVSPQGTFVPSQFVFGAKGKKSSVANALLEMNSNHITESKPFNNYKVDVLGLPPETPPTWRPMTIGEDSDGKSGKKVKTYSFDIGGKKYMYFRSNTGQWKHQEIK
jgi:hypothetical protein